MLSKYIVKNGKKLRYGYTTGSCAAAAARAAVEKLFYNKDNKIIALDTPKGWSIDIKVNGLTLNRGYAECYIIKDAGDDPDITDGIKIYARAVRIPGDSVIVKGGTGIGTVTKKGLQVEPGNPAINPVPMKMIIEEVKKVKPESEGVSIEISAPEGVELARKTFNPKIGITGGISILGTTGIVEPMSDESVKESLALNISILKDEGADTIVFVPGNYGKDFAVKKLNINPEKIAVTGNYMGYMLAQACYYEIKNIIIVGHIGKLVKIAGGIFNTHSRVADARFEILAANFIYYKNDLTVMKKIMESNTTEEAVSYIKEKDFFNILTDKIKNKCSDYVNNDLNIETVLFSIDRGLLAKTEGAEKLIKEVRLPNE